MAKLIEEVDIGDHVYCDLCNTDFIGCDESGGFLFASKAVCPRCAEGFEKTIRDCGEEEFIKAWCPAGVSFWKWCLSLRAGNNTIRVWEL